MSKKILTPDGVASPSRGPSLPKSYGGVGDPDTDLYEMLHLEPHCRLEHIEEALQAAQRWWNGQQANPKYRHRARDALARLREAREILFDPIRRQTYDRKRQTNRQHWRKVRWQPVSELVDVLLDGRMCSHKEEELILKFARRRNLNEDEIRILLNEEFLRREIERQPEPEEHKPATQASRHAYGYLGAATAMLLSLLGLVVLALSGALPTAALLLLPYACSVYLFFRGFTGSEPNTDSTVGAWEWLVGVVVLGGASVSAISSMQHDPMQPLGVSVTALIWLSWMVLVILGRHPNPHSQTDKKP